MKGLTLFCDHGRERLDGRSRVRPESAGRPTVALRETQESPDLPVIHGETSGRLLGSVTITAPPAASGEENFSDSFDSLGSLTSTRFLFCPEALFIFFLNCVLMETTTHVTDATRLQSFIMQDGA